MLAWWELQMVRGVQYLPCVSWLTFCSVLMFLEEDRNWWCYSLVCWWCWWYTVQWRKYSQVLMVSGRRSAACDTTCVPLVPVWWRECLRKRVWMMLVWLRECSRKGVGGASVMKNTDNTSVVCRGWCHGTEWSDCCCYPTCSVIQYSYVWHTLMYPYFINSNYGGANETW